MGDISLIKGLIFNIQRFSVHDGLGIRTLVLFKGCPLRCLWCSNPEGQTGTPEISFRPQKCLGCGTCLKICSEQAIRELTNQERIDRARCTGCGECARHCPSRALEIVGRSVTIEEVITEVKKDVVFYQNSGGGVTLGGGEPMRQPQFAGALLKECRQSGINTAIETCGYADWASFKFVLPHTNLFLFDLKIFNPTRHKLATGQNNALILANAKKINDYGIPMIIRIPVIPGHTNSPLNIGDIAGWAKNLEAVIRIDLLPYHKFGQAKYKQLGRQYLLTRTRVPVDSRLTKLKEIVESFNIPAQIGG